MPKSLLHKAPAWRPTILLKKTPAQVLFCKICKIIKSTYFLEHRRTAASENGSMKSNNTVRSLPSA